MRPHLIGPVVRVDATAGRRALVHRHREERADRIAHDPQPLDRVDGRPQRRRRPRATRGELRIAALPERPDDRPARRERARRLRAEHRRVHDRIPGPPRRREVLGALTVAPALQEHRGALRRVPELVQVGAHTRDAGHLEVPGRGLEPRQDPAADARVDVAGDSALGSRGRNLLDRVESCEGVARGRDDDERDILAHPVDERRSGTGSVLPDRHEFEVEVEVVRSLLECRVRRDRREQPGPAGIRMCGTPGVARGLDREQAALGPTTRDGADDVLLPVEDAPREPEHLALHGGDRGEGRRVEAVDRLHHPDGRRRELVELGQAAVVHVGEHVPAMSRSVRVAELPQAREDVGRLLLEPHRPIVSFRSR